ncbi:MAG TPA: hypothetical protein VG937_31100 [Polyangiaceae bacterium]|nr:hypothetical protein [Polyangiaceae bacterium]
MQTSLEHVEAAIAEVAKARTLVSKIKSIQVRNATDRDALKATALAWLQTHRPHVHEVDLAAIDAPYRRILDCTAKLAARSTYLSALKAAKDALVEVRREIAAAPLVPLLTGTDPPPRFAAFSADIGMQNILNRRWEEVQQCMTAGAYLAATVMMGGLLESLLLARINMEANKSPLYTAKNTPKDKAGKPLPLSEWKLVNMVGVSHDLGWVTKSAKDVGNVLRDFRNYIHPHKEHTDGITITSEDARMLWDVSKAIARQLLASVPQ